MPLHVILVNPFSTLVSPCIPVHVTPKAVDLWSSIMSALLSLQLGSLPMDVS